MTRLSSRKIPPHLRSQIPPESEDERREMYGAVRTFSNLCQRHFDSRAEALYGEYLWMLQAAGAIEGLEFQVKYELCDKPRVTIRPDFRYITMDPGGVSRTHLEDVKGHLTDAFRIKMAWLRKQYGVKVKLISARAVLEGRAAEEMGI